FPSPASDYEEGKIDLNDMLIRHPAATFLVRVQGESMLGAGIHPNDILVVDRSLTPNPGRIVIAVVDGELTVKRLLKAHNQIILMPENEAFQPIHISDQQNFMVWGVVTNVIHSVL
ncbi:MAG: translesion error-prone DNA polymerase V autoproteolytic subunit, partial [Alphaproteobacteria bacterium]|nr:translesion error-prone DNA polymerase V autoproteolytic subunit [Alphaproteobacteria bacterium]